MDPCLTATSATSPTCPSPMSTSSSASPAIHLLLLLLSRLSPSAAITPLHAAALLALCAAATVAAWWWHPGGPAWGKASSGGRAIRGPRGWPVLGSLLELMGERPHVALADLARVHGAAALMALSLGNTRVVLTSVPSVARELLNSTAFADRPIKQSAKLLLFHRAIGFAPYGDYWRKLRRIAATHLFSPKRLSALEPHRQYETAQLLRSIHDTAARSQGGVVRVRPLLQAASMNNIMKSVFGRRYDLLMSGPLGQELHPEAAQLQRMTREGFELLGAFNWSDHLPMLKWFDFQGVHSRCQKLVAEVQVFVQKIIDEHRMQALLARDGAEAAAEDSDFVDVLLSLQEQENLTDTDMIAILWEMIFRGTDTSAILMEWVLAEMVRNPHVQARAQAELDAVVGPGRRVSESDVASLPYVAAIVKETLRMHPPGPLLSWARLATSDVDLAGHHVPAGTTAMVNMWAITHDPHVWPEPTTFRPERFLEDDVDVRGGDLRLAPFGAGRRVCPGRALGMATVNLWTARLLHHFEWSAPEGCPPGSVDIAEVLKLSCEMKTPLAARPKARISLPFSV